MSDGWEFVGEKAVTYTGFEFRTHPLSTWFRTLVPVQRRWFKPVYRYRYRWPEVA